MTENLYENKIETNTIKMHRKNTLPILIQMLSIVGIIAFILGLILVVRSIFIFNFAPEFINPAATDKLQTLVDFQYYSSLSNLLQINQSKKVFSFGDKINNQYYSTKENLIPIMISGTNKILIGYFSNKNKINQLYLLDSDASEIKFYEDFSITYVKKVFSNGFVDALFSQSWYSNNQSPIEIYRSGDNVDIVSYYFDVKTKIFYILLEDKIKNNLSIISVNQLNQVNNIGNLQSLDNNYNIVHVDSNKVGLVLKKDSNCFLYSLISKDLFGYDCNKLSYNNKSFYFVQTPKNNFYEVVEWGGFYKFDINSNTKSIFNNLGTNKVPQFSSYSNSNIYFFMYQVSNQNSIITKSFEGIYSLNTANNALILLTSTYPSGISVFGDIFLVEDRLFLVTKQTNSVDLIFLDVLNPLPNWTSFILGNTDVSSLNLGTIKLINLLEENLLITD